MALRNEQLVECSHGRQQAHNESRDTRYAVATKVVGEAGEKVGTRDERLGCNVKQQMVGCPARLEPCDDGCSAVQHGELKMFNFRCLR